MITGGKLSELRSDLGNTDINDRSFYCSRPSPYPIIVTTLSKKMVIRKSKALTTLLRKLFDRLGWSEYYAFHLL